jgi:putative iron-dependent peroxidase
MAREQFGVCAEPSLHGYYLLFNALDDKNSFIRQALSRLPALFDKYADRFSEANLAGVIAIGTNYWDEIYPKGRPKHLRQFPEMASDDRIAPVCNYDIYIEIRSDRGDVNHIVATKVCELLADSVELVEQVRAFRFLDGRDLTGFVDGTENPQGYHRRGVALINEAQDVNFSAGSYLHIQRYRHNLNLWNSLEVKDQEDVFARTKVNNEEYSEENKAPTSHIKRVNLKDRDANRHQKLRQSMPYGDMKLQGLFFVSYCHSPEPFELMLASMIVGDGHGHSDHMLKYTQAETGAAFFVPSLNILAELGE